MPYNDGMTFAFAANFAALLLSFFVMGTIFGAVFAPHLRSALEDTAALVLRLQPLIFKSGNRRHY